MRAHGIAPNAATIKPAPSRAIKTDRNDSIAKPSKKRKTDAYVEDNGATDDDEAFPSNVKPDPAEHKENFMIKGEEQGHGQQLSMDEATNLMHYYGSPSPYNGGLGGEQSYSENEYGSPAAYTTSHAGAYGQQGQQPYDFGAAYGEAGMDGIPRVADQGLSYQSMMQFPSDPQGRSDSPVIVE